MNGNRIFIIALLSLVVLAGCAYVGRPVDTPFPPVNPHFTLKEMGGREATDVRYIAVDQKITLSRGRETHIWLAHTELEDNGMTVIAFGRLGNRIFDITLKDEKLHYHGRFNVVSPGQFLSDMQIAFGQTDELSLREAGFSVTEGVRGKVVHYRGKPYQRISYQDSEKPEWNTTIRIDNALQDYTMTITPLHVEKQ